MSKPSSPPASGAIDKLRRQELESSRVESFNVDQDINVLALVKGSERYIFLFDDTRRAETLRTLGRYASNPDLNFSWYDAAVLSQKVRQTVPAEPVLSERRFQLPS